MICLYSIWKLLLEKREPFLWDLKEERAVWGGEVAFSQEKLPETPAPPQREQ